MNIKQGIQKYLDNYSGKKIIGEEIVPFKALVLEIPGLIISDGEYKIPAIYSEECREEFQKKFEYLTLSELRGMNIMINNYEYILHDTKIDSCESYKGMCLKVIIHSLKPLPNEAPLNGAGKDILHNKFVKAGLEKYKYKTMQSILMESENFEYPMESHDQSQSVQMRIESEQSRISAITSNMSSLIAVFDHKMEISHKREQEEVNEEQKQMIDSIYNLNSGRYLEDETRDESLFQKETHLEEFTFSRLINPKREEEVSNYIKLNEVYIKEMDIEDKRQCKMKEESQKFENRQKALKLSSKDHVVQRINKMMNKPSESNVHQRGNIDLSNTYVIKEGIKQVIENEKLKINDESDQEEENSDPSHYSKKRNELKSTDEEEKGETGSILGISELKSYLEWYYLKKHNQEENTLPEECSNPPDGKTMYNANTKPCSGVIDPKSMTKDYQEKENISENIQPIKTVAAPKNPFASFESSFAKNNLSGIKRNAGFESISNKLLNRAYKRKCLGQESEDRLAELFREKIHYRRNKNLKYRDDAEDIDENEPKPDLSRIEEQDEEESKQEIQVSDTSFPNILNRDTLLRNEEDLQDSSNQGASIHEASLDVNTPMRSEISSQALNSSMYSQAGKRSMKSSKYCGKKRTLENKRNRKYTKISVHEKLANSIYFSK
ncbi:unnamed protein product [Moneuplotes crassus]|uniref:Uncharacterized protein n=1 Tax=Euplotes crassus TaxID=5936 RepID=A0AAD1X6R2_EUPCR|nr:unnamed protein product [Moneuplotes crassus]